MSAPAVPAVDPQPPRPSASVVTSRLAGLLVLAAVLGVVVLVSLAVGARPMSLGVAWAAIVAPDGSVRTMDPGETAWVALGTSVELADGISVLIAHPQ